MQSIIKKQALSQIKAQHNPVKIFVAPTMKFMEWRVAIQTEEHDYVEEHLVEMLSLVIKLNDRNFLQTLYSGRLKVIKTLEHF